MSSCKCSLYTIYSVSLSFDTTQLFIITYVTLAFKVNNVFPSKKEKSAIDEREKKVSAKSIV